MKNLSIGSASGRRRWGVLCGIGISAASTIIACDKLGGASKETAASATPTTEAAPAPAPVPAANEVVRYSNMEVAESGSVSIRQAVRARKAADRSSDVVETLQPGTGVNRVARYAGFSLVQWNNGTGQGWVETAIAFQNVPLVDAGVRDRGDGIFGPVDAGAVPPPPATTTPPPPATTTPPPPATTTPPPPATTTPPPPATTTRPPPVPDAGRQPTPPVRDAGRPSGPRPPRL